MVIKFSDHAYKRVEESGHSLGSLKRIIANIPKLEGKIRWRTSSGVLVLERVNPNFVLVKTYIPRYKFNRNRCEYKYRKGCHVY